MLDGVCAFVCLERRFKFLVCFDTIRKMVANGLMCVIKLCVNIGYVERYWCGVN